MMLMMFLVIFAISALLFLDPTSLFRSKDPDMPWSQENRILKSDQTVPKPSENQPAINTYFAVRTTITEESQYRGKIMLSITPEGRIKGSWGGEYNLEKGVSHNVMNAVFAGNIDPSMEYTDSSGQDPSKLYFITKGHFLILEFRSTNSRTRSIKGLIYVTGWIDRDYNVQGYLTLTSDKKDCRIYPWKGVAEKGQRIFIPETGRSLFKLLK